MLTKPNFEKIGNPGEPYEHLPRHVQSHGLVILRPLVLKVYSMTREGGEPPTDGMVTDVKNMLEERTYESDIDPLIGMGFSILSDRIVNVARWDKDDPTVLKNQLYVFDGDVDSAHPWDIREEGTFSISELRIVDHEGKAWGRFLASDRGIDAKRGYLEDMMRSEI